MADLHSSDDSLNCGRRDFFQLVGTAGVFTGAVATGAQAQTGTQGPQVDHEPRGIPGARNFDHAGIAVRDLDEALSFFLDVLGADLLYRVGPFAHLESKEEAEAGTTVEVAFLRFGVNVNIELLQFRGPDTVKTPPRVSDEGAIHIAVWVEDMQKAVDYMRAQPGVEIVGEIGAPDQGQDRGASWIYARTPFGLHVELGNRPPSMPYEQTSKARVYGPAPAWSNV